MIINVKFPDNIIPIGTAVYIPRPALKSVLEDTVVGYYCILSKDNLGYDILQPTDYRLTTANVGHGSLSDAWKRDEFFLSYEDALANALEYPIKATDEQWMQAIGLDSNSEGKSDLEEDCELAPCCAEISVIREILYDACLAGSMDSVTRNRLIELMNKHEPPTEKPVLDSILLCLDLTWTDSLVHDEYVTKLK